MNKPPFVFLTLMLVASIISVLFMVSVFFYSPHNQDQKITSKFDERYIGEVFPHKKPAPTPTPTSAPPTPSPYPPAGYHCIQLPILMYHHVEPLTLAKTEGHAQLTVDSGTFATQMQYLADHGYTTIQLQDLANYFDTSKALPKKAVILTFDDAYSDFHDYAVPVLASHHFVSDLFVPTGLVENPGYLTWGNIKDDSTKGVSIDHHTWSHANVAQVNDAFFHRELDIATQQLIDHGYGPVNIFAYPYGTHNGRDITELAKRGFRIAVTTLAGQLQCKEDRLALHRTRIGNSPLAAYGL